MAARLSLGDIGTDLPTDETQEDAPKSVVFENVSKRFRKPKNERRGYSTLKSMLLHPFRKQNPDELPYFQALNEICLSVPEGKSLGVIGRNGSGKSTLLKLIAGIYLPDGGLVKVQGRISALIELGAGFHPDFSGRENIYLGGIMYGLTRKQIDARFDEIVKYAQLEDFIDNPVRTYSSGMYMRLGFSLAVHTDPDILLVDEVLAVGDASFINRCHDTISDFKRRGKTLIFVTHDLSSVARWCDEAIWLDKGNIRLRGEPRRVIDAYLQQVGVEEEDRLALENSTLQNGTPSSRTPKDGRTATEQQWGNGDVEITDVRMFGRDGALRWVYQDDEDVTIEVAYRIHQPLDDLVFGIGILRVDGLDVHGNNTEIDEVSPPLPDTAQIGSYPVSGMFRYRIKRLSLLENSYYLDVAAHRSDGLPFDYHHRLHKFSIRTTVHPSGIFSPDHSWEFVADYPVDQTVSRKGQNQDLQDEEPKAIQVRLP